MAARYPACFPGNQSLDAPGNLDARSVPTGRLPALPRCLFARKKVGGNAAALHMFGGLSPGGCWEKKKTMQKRTGRAKSSHENTYYVARALATLAFAAVLARLSEKALESPLPRLQRNLRRAHHDKCQRP